MSEVNLDALIPREDFASDIVAEGNYDIKEISLQHLLPDPEKNYGSIYHLLRKPDFQRETNEWSKEKICDLLECIINESFIPSIIVWANKDNRKIYIIDGAHRLSAFISYINDDYGDRTISQQFYGYKIPPADRKNAQDARDYINKKIGKFADLIKGGKTADILRTHKFLVQNIDGSLTKAEDSFFKINEQGVVISPTEKELCKNRHKPTCIATRAIMKGGAGNQYWKNFTLENQEIVKAFAEELHKSLFEPPYEPNIVSIVKDHPLGGNTTSAMTMVYNLLKIVKNHKKIKKEVEDRTDGSPTIAHLEGVRKIIRLMLSSVAGSLGLHPTIYFYNAVGKYIESTFMGMFALLIENQSNTDFKIKFTKNRERLEDFLIEYKIFLTQINSKKGSKERSANHMKWFFANLIDYLNDNGTNEKVVELLKIKYDFLNENESSVENYRSNRFTTEVKNESTIYSDLQSTTRCKICGGYVHPLSKDFDHDLDKKFGGNSKTENSVITHIYCNNSKDKLRQIGFYKG